jgi:hypothetical protein
LGSGGSLGGIATERYISKHYKRLREETAGYDEYAS